MRRFILTIALVAIVSLCLGTNRPGFAGNASTAAASGQTPTATAVSGSSGATSKQSAPVSGGGPQVKPMPPIQSSQAIKPRVPTKPRP